MEEKYIKQIRELKQRHIYGDFIYNIMNNPYSILTSWRDRQTLDDVLIAVREEEGYILNPTILQYAFLWRATIQDSSFWQSIDDSLRKIK